MRHARRGPRAWPTKVYRWTESNLHFATAVKDRRGPKMNYNWMRQSSFRDRFEVRDPRLPSRAMAWTTHSSAVVAILSSRVSLMEPPRKQQSPQQNGLAPEARAYLAHWGKSALWCSRFAKAPQSRGSNTWPRVAPACARSAEDHDRGAAGTQGSVCTDTSVWSCITRGIWGVCTWTLR